MDQTLKDYDKLLAAVVKRPEYTIGLDRLKRGGINLGYLLMVEGVVEANGASEIVTRAMQTVDVVSKKVSEKVGPIREQILDNIDAC